MQQVNDRLDTKVYVEEVNLRIFQKFPSTSIELKGITIWSSHNFDTRSFGRTGADTLLTAETVNISFSIFGLIRKQYNIRQLEIKNGSLRLFTDLSGEGNYKMISQDNSKGQKEQQVNLSQLRISNFDIFLDNRVKQLVSESNVEQLDLNGRFSSRNTQIKGSLKGILGEISNKGILYASDRDIRVKLNLNVIDSLFTIKAAQLQIDRILADVDGTFRLNTEKGIELDLYAAARDLSIHEVLDLLPVSMNSTLQNIEGNGILQIYTRITGVANATLTPKIDADFQTSEANLKWDRIPFGVRNLDLTGSYSNGGEFNPVTTSLLIESVSAMIGDDHLSGKGRIKNFYDPEFAFELRGDIHPEQWIKWYESIGINNINGTIVSDISVKGSYDRLNPPGERFLYFDITGGISLEDIYLQINESSTPITGLNGMVQIENDFWKHSFSGNLGKSDFYISGSGLNLLSFLMEGKQELVTSATFRSDYLDLQEVLDLLPGTDPGDTSSIRFPEMVHLKLDFLINELTKERFHASGVSGIARYDSPFLHLDSLSMQTMDGTITGQFGMAQDHHNAIFTNVNANLRDLDIQKLFYAFNNFGQTQITHEHLKGSISGTSAFSASFSPSFSILTETILSENTLVIRQGELNGFSPIMALSRFVDLEELRNIQFETLENTILIKDNQVIIPAMDIHSNALNLSASGTHKFSNQYDYRLKLLMSELLYNKARRSDNPEFVMAVDNSDTRTLFLKVYDNGSGASVEVDRDKTAEKIREDLKEERLELKGILNEELGLFKKDEEVLTRKKQQSESEEIFKFEFSDETDTIVEDAPGRTPWWKKRTKKDTLQNKQVREFVIDE